MGDIYLPLTRLLLLANQMSANLTRQNSGGYVAERRPSLYAYDDYENGYGGLKI